MAAAGGFGRYTRTAFFASCPGAVSRLHYDHYDNIYVQLRGRKRFVLLEPTQAAGLYPFPMHHPLDQRARVHLDALPASSPPSDQTWALTHDSTGPLLSSHPPSSLHAHQSSLRVPRWRKPPPPPATRQSMRARRLPPGRCLQGSTRPTASRSTSALARFSSFRTIVSIPSTPLPRAPTPSNATLQLHTLQLHTLQLHTLQLHTSLNVQGGIMSRRRRAMAPSTASLCPSTSGSTFSRASSHHHCRCVRGCC